MPGPSGDVIASSWLCASDEDFPASVASPQVDMIAGAWECTSNYEDNMAENRSALTSAPVREGSTDCEYNIAIYIQASLIKTSS